MKLIYFFILLLFISCQSSRHISNIDIKVDISDTVAASSVDTGRVDTIQNDKIDNLTSASAPEETPIRRKKPKEIKVINYIDTNDLKKPNYGIIGYNVPEKFQVNVYSVVKLRITRSKKTKSVMVGDRKIPLADEGSGDYVYLESIEIDSIMTAKLYVNGDIFDVELESSEKQKLSDKGYIEWYWSIKPKKGGNQKIRLLITMSDREIPVYEKVIYVKKSYLWSFSQWVGKWWQAITATLITPIIIPLIIWFWKKQKKSGP